jgi:hypothetical protein
MYFSTWGCIMRKYLVIVSALFLASCQTDDRFERLHPYIGTSMADFSRSTGMVPSDTYDTAGGRTFVVNGAPIAVAVSPGVTVAGGCRMLVDTILVSKTHTADDWRIVAINATGPC